MHSSLPLLIDTTSLLRADLGGFGFTGEVLDEHSLQVIQSLVVFDRILLDGPSIERNSRSLEYVHWLAREADDIEIIDISSADERSLYKGATALARRTCFSGKSGNLIMPGRMPLALVKEMRRPDGREFRQSTYWEDFWRELESDEYLKELLSVFCERLGGYAPLSTGAFVALARSFYYLCLQESLGSSLLLDPSKALDSPGFYYSDFDDYSDFNNTLYCGNILDLFDEKVRDSFLARKRKWLGEVPRSLSLPLLANYIDRESKSRGWNVWRVIHWMRQSREVKIFRDGLAELQAAVDSNDASRLDAIFTELDAAAESWSSKLGVSRSKGGRGEISVSVSLPLVSVGKSIPLPHLPRRSTSDKLLIFVNQLLSVA
jgi:hypothetical protein